jgi:hypothetical protein
MTKAEVPLDPLEAVREILKHNKTRAPIDYVDFARRIVDKFGGIDELAGKLYELVDGCEGDQAAMRGMAAVMDLLNKAHDRQEARMTVGNLPDEELEACVQELVLHGKRLVSESEDTFGTGA